MTPTFRYHPAVVAQAFATLGVLVEVILSESIRVVRARRGVLIVEHRLGFIMAKRPGG